MPHDHAIPARPIRGILSDVDGVLCNGQITYDAGGIETKSFHVRDGLGIKLWLQSRRRFGIITARESPIVTKRAKELGIADVHQNSGDKWERAESILHAWGLTADEVAYIGDDLPDLAVMRRVGLSVAPSDAALDVRQSADWVLPTAGGQGVVRELIERLMRDAGDWPSSDGHSPPPNDASC